MTIIDFARTWMRQLSFALTLFTAVLCVAERLAPGSVLSYTNIYAWVIASLVLTVLAPTVETRRRWRVIGLIPLVLLLIAFLVMTTWDVGRWGFVLTVAASLVAVAVLAILAYPAEEESYE